ncbi:MAG: hypothetical protein ACTSSE_18710 [Candidatus Thorarchaeota archaeon]|jgi:hypothetical protein
MSSEAWKEEWNKFTPEAIEEMKEYSDQTHLHREWMSYVYEKDGKYHLGKPSYGDESRIEVNPNEKAREDSSKGLSEGERKWTIHGHPLKDGKIYTGRQYFSSTDILQEFVKARDNDEKVVQYVVYPHQQDKNGQKIIHNRVRILVFPNRSTIIKAMKMAHPEMTDEQIMAINEKNGYNKNAVDGSLKNEAGVDWFAFQEALGKLGYMGIIDIEGPTDGSTKVDAADTMFVQNSETVRNPMYLALGVVGILALGKWWFTGKVLGADTIVEEGFGADFEHSCFWK